MGLHAFQTLRHLREGIVNTSQVAASIPAKLYPVGHFPFKGQIVDFFKGIKGYLHGKAAIAADRHRVAPLDLLAGIQQRGTGVFLVGQVIAANLHAGEPIQRMGVCRQRHHIRLKAPNKALALLDLLREVFKQVILQTELLALVVCLHQPEPGYVDVQVHTLLDERISGAQRFDFGIGESRFIDVLTGANRAFAGHDLRNEFLLGFHGLIQIAVEGSFRHITENMHLLVPVALPDDTPLALFQIAGPPRAIQVMERHKPILHVGARAHLESAAKKHAHLAGAHLGKQLLFTHIRVGRVNKRNLLGGNASRKEFLPDILIHGKHRFIRSFRRFRHVLQRAQLHAVDGLVPGLGSDGLRVSRACLGGGNIAENKLGQAIRLSLIPYIKNIVHAQIDLALRLVGQHGVDDALVKAELAPVRGDFQHVIDGRVYRAGVDEGRPFGKRLHHVLLMLGGMGRHVMKHRLRHGKI
ncbi:hypothetical protein SDC9_79984 [bioreactor metagenome]|uniref:Uncharacterized protein n=1 Tax=bioreactor metagenome TaxID=1076179 RepID=A0A644YYM9_9ZZZZ